MPYDRRRVDEDPEEVAEREYEKCLAREARFKVPAVPKKLKENVENGIQQNGTTNEKKESEPVPILTDSGNASAASSLKQANSFKESKALRKKRSRGISGSSIKKDGGRFEMGYDDYAYDEFGFSDPEDEAVGHMNNTRSYDPQYRQFPVDLVPKVRAGFQLAMLNPSNPDISTLLNLLDRDDLTQNTQFLVIHEALANMVDDLSPSLVKDALGEYHLAVALARLIQKHWSNDDIEELQVVWNEVLRASPLSKHVDRIFKTAKDFIVYNTEELRGDLAECPDDQIDEVVQLIVNSSTSITETEHLDLFYSEIAFRCFVAASTTMSFDTINATVYGFYDTILQTHETFRPAFRIGFSRFLERISDLEVDVPALRSLANLLLRVANVVGLIEDRDPAISKIMVSPTVFLGRRMESGTLYVVDCKDEIPTMVNFLLD